MVETIMQAIAAAMRDKTVTPGLTVAPRHPVDGPDRLFLTGMLNLRSLAEAIQRALEGLGNAGR